MVGFLLSYLGYINLTIFLIPPFDSITAIRGELGLSIWLTDRRVFESP